MRYLFLFIVLLVVISCDTKVLTTNEEEDQDFTHFEEKGLDGDKQHSEETVVGAEGPLKLVKKLDLLFYIYRRDSPCVKNFNHYARENGFLQHLDHLDWQVSFSYYSQLETHFLPLEYHNGEAMNTNGGFFKPTKRDYVLSKGEYSKRDQIFYTTLSPSYSIEEDEENGVHDPTPNYNKRRVSNPLLGLDHILSTKVEESVRSDSHVVVLLFGYRFPYYSSQEWQQFFNKHENVGIIAMPYRSANIFNFTHILEKDEYNFDFLPVCYNKDSPGLLIEMITHKTQ